MHGGVDGWRGGWMDEWMSQQNTPSGLFAATFPFSFFLDCMPCRILVLQPGIEPVPLK